MKTDTPNIPRNALCILCQPDVPGMRAIAAIRTPEANNTTDVVLLRSFCFCSSFSLALAAFGEEALLLPEAFFLTFF